MKRRSGVGTEAGEVARLLREINRRVRDQPVEADIARSGLTWPQISTITILYERGPLSLKELSGELGLSHSTVSGIVDRLQRRGFVKRAVDRADRRVTRIGVTDEVNRYARRGYIGAQAGRLHPALQAATKTQRQAIKESLRLLHSLLAETAD